MTGTAVDPSFALRSLDRQWAWRYSAITTALPPGSSHTFSFAVGAPNTVSPFTFAARTSALGLGDFGDFVIVPTTVTSSAIPHWGCKYLAAASSIPTQLAPNENRAFTITVENSGTGTWTPGFFFASEDSPPSFWGQTNLALGETHFLSFWYDIWVSGTGTLVCE